MLLDGRVLHNNRDALNGTHDTGQQLVATLVRTRDGRIDIIRLKIDSIYRNYTSWKCLEECLQPALHEHNLSSVISCYRGMLHTQTDAQYPDIHPPLALPI